ncbi:MAG: hypothetical protein DRJ03_09960 [Chloroflexi bacterium]|nr:MAG: hypothetical protein DRI81_03305 [Chloroflexota bacterium]RLC86026.1 MAG: hypothetical protein DRJ03_09960 [Chloroflexota bacterium]
MYVAQFISHFPYQDQFSDSRYASSYVCSGGEIAAYEVAVNLARRDHKVEVFTSSVDRSNSTETFDMLDIHRYGSWFRIGDTRISPELLWGPLRGTRDVDVVHVQHTTPPGGAAGLLYAKTRCKPLVVTHHGFERPDSYGSPLRKIVVYLTANLFVDRLFSQAAAIISISPYFINESRFLSKYQHKTVNIPNGVNLEEYKTALTKAASRKQLGLLLDHPVILFLGSLIPRKGGDVLLRAMRRVVDVFPTAELVLVGRGPMMDLLKRHVSELDLAHRVRFEGFIGDSALKAIYYKAADVYVVPSVNSMEMFPLVLLEASALGCAMVVSDLATFRCIIDHGYNGIVTRAGDEASLADGIVSVLQNPDLQRRLSEHARKRVQQFSWQTIAAQTEDLYQQIVQSGDADIRVG